MERPTGQAAVGRYPEPVQQAINNFKDRIKKSDDVVVGAGPNPYFHVPDPLRGRSSLLPTFDQLVYGGMKIYVWHPEKFHAKVLSCYFSKDGKLPCPWCKTASHVTQDGWQQMRMITAADAMEGLISWGYKCSNTSEHEDPSGLPFSMTTWLDASDWDALRANYSAHDEQREYIIKRSRDVQKSAKQAVFCLHRQQLDKCKEHLQVAETALHEMLPITKQYPSLRLGSFSNALEEFAEAHILKVYMTEWRIPARPEIPLVSINEYLGGLLDFSGELNRQAVPVATNRDKDTLAKYRQLVSDMVEKFMLLNLHNPGLRKKLGPLQGTLNKLEYMMYELSLTENSVIKHVDDTMAFVNQGKEDADDDANH